MQEFSNTASVSSVSPATTGATASQLPQVPPPVLGMALAVVGAILLAVVFRSRRIHRRRLQIALTAYAERQLLRERPARASSVMSRSV